MTTSGTHYIAAGAFSDTGTYTVEVTDATPAFDQPGVPQAPVFEQPDYTFELRENEDGSTSRVSIGTVSANDPEGSAVSYSIVGGNESGMFEVDGVSGELFYTGTGEDAEDGPFEHELTVRGARRRGSHHGYCRHHRYQGPEGLRSSV